LQQQATAIYFQTTCNQQSLALTNMSSSAVIQSLLGKWKDSSADAENLEAYLKAIGKTTFN